MDSSEEEKKMQVFKWKIDNFSMCTLKRREKLFSPIFKAKSFNESIWQLILYPRGSESSDDGFISLYLAREEDDANSLDIECDYIIEVIDKSGHAVHSQKTFAKRKFEKGVHYGWNNYMKADQLRKTALFDDSLIIQCILRKNLPEKISYSENTSYTKFKISNHSFQFVVKDFNSVTRKEIIKSPCSGPSQIEVTIEIPKDDVKICMLIDESVTCSLFLMCKFILLDIEGKERNSRRATHLFEKSETWEIPTFIRKSQLYAERDVYLKDGCFRLQCNIVVSDGSIVTDNKKTDFPVTDKLTVSAQDTEESELNEDIKRMYEDKIHADLRLKVGKEVYLAHKSILCARSPVFKAMFDYDMAESQKGEVDIPDLNAKTVGLFLEYIYTGSVKDLDYENAVKLIVAAEKYQVLSLKTKCADLLAKMLSDENVCEILVAADLVQHDILKASVINHIKKQPKKIFNSEKWKQCIKNNLLLATETATKVAMMLENQAK